MEENLITVEARCTYILFQNPSNHYFVARFEQLDSTKVAFTGVGYLKGIERDSCYHLQGLYVEHYKYGPQFQIHSCERIVAAEQEMLVKFFSGPHFPGIGKKMASRLFETLGEDIVIKIRENSNCLDQVPGMNENKKRVLIEGLRESAVFDDEYARLQGSGLSIRQISRLEDHYGCDFLDVLKSDPFRPFYELNGFGLRSCEQLASCLNAEKNSEQHRCAQLMDLFQQQCFKSGSTYLEKEMFLHFVYQNDLFEHNAEDLIGILCSTGPMVEEEGRLYERQQYEGELIIAQKLKQLTGEQDRADSEILLQELCAIEQELSIQYDSLQRQAILGFFSHSFMILNGGPGTGKTTTIQGILKLYQKLFPQEDIVLAAPTGRAAKRLSELSSYHASTIHSLLKWDLETNTFMVNEHDPLSCDVLIIDEFSMVDNRLFAQLLKAVKDDTRLLLIGDDDQLPSVSSGRVLHDLIQSDLFPVYSLQHIFRQAKGSGIASLAAEIRDAQPLTFDNDVSFLDCTAQQVRKTLLHVVANALEKGYDPRDIQVLAPKYQGNAGIDVLNQDLQALLNPADDHKRELRVGSRIFREGDKVLQLKNMREDAVYNGDIGEIIEIVSEDENALSAAEIVVSFDDQIVEYAQDTLYYLTHAYCISIHKSQGNEYPIVILPVISEQRFMLNRRLLYTAVTRAKSALVVMGDRELFTASIQKEEQRLRNTSLVQHLQFYFSDCDDIPLPDFQPLAMSDE